MKQKTARRIYIILAIVILALTIIGLLTACDFEPIVDERCYDDYENFSFYQIEQEGPLGTMKTSYRLETPHGDIDIPDKVYEGAMEYDYLEICYQREDNIATEYLYTKKGENLQPEPEVIVEIQEVEVEKIVEVIKYAVVSDFTFEGQQVQYAMPVDNFAWITIRIDQENVNADDGVDLIPNFIRGDIIMAVWVWDENILSDDMIWKAQTLHFRSGVLLESYTAESLWVAEPGYSSFEEYIQYEIEQHVTQGLQVELNNAHELLYPEVE